MNTPLKPPAAALRAHAARDFHRGMQTKNLVKGAGGGARGVDFQDAEADYNDRRLRGGADGAEATAGSEGARDRVAQAKDASAQMERNAAELVLLDLNQPQKVDAPVDAVDQDDRQRKQQRRHMGAQQDDEHKPASEEPVPPDQDLTQAPDSPAHEQFLLHAITRTLADPTAESRVFGALVLQDPEKMRKTLSTPIRVAKHLLVLAGRLLERGQDRAQVTEYLATTFLALGPEFGVRAFRDFAYSIGIGSIYPLEVLERMLLADDKFFPESVKCRFTAGRRMLTGKVQDTIVIEYPEELTITGFAVKGGTRVGYQLVPMKEKGKHGLRVFQPGEYRVLLAGVDPMGFERLEEIRVTVTPNEALRAAVPSLSKAPPVPRAVTFNRLKAGKKPGT